MKRLLLLLAGVCALAAWVSPAMAAEEYPYLTLEPNAATVVYGADVELHGVWANWTDLLNKQITVFRFDDETCSTDVDPENAPAPFTDEDGAFAVDFGPLEVGSYWFSAWFWGDIWSPCVQVDVVEPPAPEPVVVPKVPSDELVSSYLCWNREMANPVAYIDKTADAMWKTGKYFEPAAVLGTLKDGTNIGAYHLVCNTTGLTVTDTTLGGSGEVYNALGTVLYHQEHLGGNDLNLYHIWK